MNTRRFSLVLAFTIVSATVLLCELLPLTRSSTAAPAPAAETNFKGKMLLIMMESRSAVIEDVRVRKLGVRNFLVGKGVDDGREGNWAKGQILWIPLDRITMMTEFDNKEAMMKAMQEGTRPVAPGDRDPELPPSK